MTEYYVSPVGSPKNSGLSADEAFTLQAVKDIAKLGDTIHYVEDGNYSANDTKIKKTK